MRVVIMRGLPGSGKSSWIKQQLPDASVWSADNYHMVDGVYRYDPKKAGEAHAWCLKGFLDDLRADLKMPIVVDNTNTTAVEIAPYAAAAGAHKAEFKIVYLHCPLGLAVARGIHNVPVATMLKMQRNLLTEELPPYWPQTVIFSE